MNLAINKKRKRQLDEDKLKDQEQAAQIYAEYIRSFEPEDNEDTSTFVKSTRLNHVSGSGSGSNWKGEKKKEIAEEGNKKDTMKINTQWTKKEKVKKNVEMKEIDSFLEEIKKKQKIWDEKKQLQERIEQNISREERNEISRKLKEIEKNDMIASYYPKREMFANLFLNNLSPEVTEEFLCKKFGKFGPVHSIKIMYPRTEEEKRRNRVNGFVCFEHKEDAEAAKDALNGTEILGHVVKIGWSKAIPKMTNEKNEINNLLMNLHKQKKIENKTEISVGIDSSVDVANSIPVVTSTLIDTKLEAKAKNANNHIYESTLIKSNMKHVEKKEKGFIDNHLFNMQRGLQDEYKVIQLNMPSDKKIKEAIDLLAEYVTEEGFIFEETIKKREKNNSFFSFLFNENDLSNYYRWRVYSFSQGDTAENWRTHPFQIFKNGTIYIPPPLKKKMVLKKDVKKRKCVELSAIQKKKLVQILCRLNKKRISICRAMIFCARHSDASNSVVKIISNFLTDNKQDLLKKVNVMYLVSDLLRNCSNEYYSLWSYRKYVEMELPRIFYFFKKHLKKCESKVKAKLFVDSVMKLFCVWENWSLFNFFFMNGLKCFLSYQKVNDKKKDMDESLYQEELDGEKIAFFDEIKIYPLHLRQKAFIYFTQEDNQLNRLCEQRGLYYDEHFTKKKKIKYLVTYDEFCTKGRRFYKKIENDTTRMEDTTMISEFNRDVHVNEHNAKDF